jgi:hypothetical protein
MRAWVKAETLIRLTEEQTLFNIASLKVSMSDAMFQSTIDVSADRSGAVRRSARGTVRADWNVTLGGFQIVTFRQTTLEYTDGKLHFDFSPEKIVLSQVLKFLSDLMNSIGFKDGFQLKLISAGMIPVGVRAELLLPLPPMGGGTTAVVNLTLRAGFELRAMSDQLRPDFSIAVFLALSSKDAPFAITFFILGGSGYIELGARYTPARGAFAIYVRLSIYACAMLAVAFGPIHGEVFIGVGVGADFEAETGHPVALSVGAEILIRGAVDVCGIITATITLLLQLRYEKSERGTRLVGRGQLDISIKICWCFTLHVSVGVTFGFNTSGGGEGNSAQARAMPFVNPLLAIAGMVQMDAGAACDPRGIYVQRATEYLEMFD